MQTGVWQEMQKGTETLYVSLNKRKEMVSWVEDPNVPTRAKIQHYIGKAGFERIDQAITILKVD